MIDIATLPNVGAPTANHDKGEFTDDITPGDGLGTPVREDWQSDLIYSLYEIMGLAGLSPDGSVEGATQSQVRNAIQAIANGITAQRFNRATSYTILDTDFYRTIFVDTTAGDVTITMPLLANNIARKIRIIHAKGGTNKVIIAPNAGDANTLTIDALAVIWLPRVGDFIDFENNDTVGALLWQSINERITTVLRLDTYTAYGSAETMIPRFVNTREILGNLISQNHTTGYNGGTEGLRIVANKSGNYGFSFSMYSSAVDGTCGLSLNSAQLTTVLSSITVADRLCYEEITGQGGLCVAWSDYLNKGDIVRPHTNASIPATADRCHFTVSYLGN